MQVNLPIGLKCDMMKRVFLLLILVGMAGAASAQSYQLHTVYIYSFIKYVQWPVEQGDFTIGVLGESPITDHLTKMSQTKKAGARNIVIRNFVSANDVEPTDILFVAETSSPELVNLLDRLQAGHTLVITEKEGMAAEGSAINFVIRNGKLAFELNKSSTDMAGLKISTELSRLAIII